MFYLDPQRKLTRRESSLITRRTSPQSGYFDDEALSTVRVASSVRNTNVSMSSMVVRPKMTVQQEVVTMMFESMLNVIVESWEVIGPPKHESLPNEIAEKINGQSIRRRSTVKGSSKRKNRSKLEISEIIQDASFTNIWWSSPDKKAIIHFRNGNVYEGEISMKCMHGEGRFQWANGTVYLGKFNNNEIKGKGKLEWKDDTWYEGDFVGNLRHGKGLYMDSRNQRSYAGGWHCGTKHGYGVIYYSESFKNSYDGEWEYNIRNGLGSREYCPLGGYKGQWNHYVREGKGFMIWPNRDFYEGQWKNGVMSGIGIYIWETHYNNTMSPPSISSYRGSWENGKRTGFGFLNLGMGFGCHYKGDFKENKKHGRGRLVTNNGLIIQDKKLFIDDNLQPLSCGNHEAAQHINQGHIEPYQFDIYDDGAGLLYHVNRAFVNIDRQLEIRTNIINEYVENNKHIETDVRQEKDKANADEPENIQDLILFEEKSLLKALRYYENNLKKIYYQYAKICNTNEILFTPILLRLYLWQLFYDCNIHEKGLTLVDIDKLLYDNPKWLCRMPHNPFEKIYYWQFTHSLVSVATKLYCKRQLPGTKPDTIVANAFRTFMKNDILEGAGRCKGRLLDIYGQYMPLKGIYGLYLSIGEPHTVRDFLRAIRRAAHLVDEPQPPLVETPDCCLPLGRNRVVFGDEMTFITDKEVPEDDAKQRPNLKLFNFGNLSCKAVIKIFTHIFPQISSHDKILDLNIKINFFEFFEAFIACTEESIRLKDEEIRWQEDFQMNHLNVNFSAIGHKAK